MPTMDPEEMFAEAFGNFDPFEEGKNDSDNQTGGNIDYPLTLTFQEAAQGTTKTLTYSSQLKCSACKGSGASTYGKVQSCRTCDGQGHVVEGSGMFQRPRTCTDCEGYGSIIKPADQCGACKGVGTIKKSRTLKVKIPAAVDSSQQVRLVGKGHVGPRNSGKNGTLFLGLSVKEDDRIRRDGLDLHADVYLTVAQAVLGDRSHRVKTLDGEVELRVPAGVQPGEKRVLKRRGLVRGTKAGDFYIHFHVAIPTSISARQKELMGEFGAGESVTPYAGSFLHRLKKRVGM
eukprot:TRINITY_DN1588_c0_g3_i2.p1 TRINITY_DN1588_c0_g3~~TRINITY_DN1588_c0_g3_i2.p1  ORF type:complete len:288 (-),score=43.33 TRINITY_DN1588_c0_g3_i2:159-1022(-)